MDYKGLLSDFDGTVHYDNQVVAEPVLAALRRLRAAGISFGFSTGRQFEFIQPYAAQFGRAHIVCGGAALVDAAGNAIRQTVIESEIARDLAHFVESAGGLVVLKNHRYGWGNDQALEVAARRPGLKLHPLADLDQWEAVAFYITHLSDDHWVQLIERYDLHICRQKNRFDENNIFADITAPGVSKAQGALWWCEYHDLDPQSVVAVGDGENDIPLLAAVGLGLAMGNSIPELKAQAAAVVPSIDEDGVAWIIKEYFGV